MNYIKLQKGFSKHCKEKFIPALARLLWHDLVELFNELGWPEWVQVSNARLMDGLQITSKTKFIEIRNKLIEQNLLVYEKGKKGFPNRYKFNLDIKFVKESSEETQNRTHSVPHSEPYPVPQTGHINKLNKTKPNKTKLPLESTNVLSSPKRGMNEFGPMFAEFWEAYPKKVAKQAALKAFAKLKCDEVTLGKILEGVARWRASDQWCELKYVPNPDKFLNGERWKDEIPEGGKYAANRDKPRFKATREYPE